MQIYMDESGGVANPNVIDKISAAPHLAMLITADKALCKDPTITGHELNLELEKQHSNSVGQDHGRVR